MPSLIAIAIGSALVLAIGVWAWIRRARRLEDHMMGSISRAWIAELRAHERDSSG